MYIFLAIHAKFSINGANRIRHFAFFHRFNNLTQYNFKMVINPAVIFIIKNTGYKYSGGLYVPLGAHTPQ